MQSQGDAGPSRSALVVDVGRNTIRIGITDDAGVLLGDSIREYGPVAQPTVSGAISTIASEAGLLELPRRLAVAVAGLSRGDLISLTNGRWRVSRSGLTAMMQAPPLILNDFAANAWAIGSPVCTGRLEALGGVGVRPQQPGTYCILGVGSGLGVAILSRDGRGTVNVIATEAGNSAFPSGLTEAGAVSREIGTRLGFVTSEMLVSGPGLVSIYRAIAKERKVPFATSDPLEVVRLCTSVRDPVATEAVSLFGKALWYLAGNLVLSCGAWDGVILTGKLMVALRGQLQRPELVERSP